MLLSLIVVPLGLLGGLILALLASVQHPLVRWPLMAWVDFFRAFPPLVLLILLFAGLPFAGLELGGFACVAIAFFLNTGAYYGEILRAGIESRAGAARSRPRARTGLGRLQAMAYVVLPQAVRNVLPDLLSNTLEVVKLTSLGSVVAVPELLFQARQAQSLTYNPTPIVLAAVIYFLMLWPLVRLLSRLENRALARPLAGRVDGHRLGQTAHGDSADGNEPCAWQCLGRGGRKKQRSAMFLAERLQAGGEVHRVAMDRVALAAAAADIAGDQGPVLMPMRTRMRSPANSRSATQARIARAACEGVGRMCGSSSGTLKVASTASPWNCVTMPLCAPMILVTSSK